MSFFRRPSKRRQRPAERVRFRHGPDAHDPQLIVSLLAFVLLWMIVMASQSALAGAATGRVATPRLVSPADDAKVQTVPGFSWRAVRRAAKYEFQASADRAFESIVLGQGTGSFFTRNTFATVPEALVDGKYYWRVRAVDARDRSGRWSTVRSIEKRWTDTPVLLGPPDGGVVSYPRTPLVLRWEEIPGAYKYLVRISTDPALANSALGARRPAIETSGTAFALPSALAPGRYYWAVTPMDAQKHPGRRSAVGSFEWTWPTQTATRVTDLDADPRVMDPQVSWDPVPGAAQYQVEVNPSQDFAVGSRVCCDEPVIGTSHSPLRLLPNNTYYWRVRAIDVDGNAGTWNAGPTFKKDFDNVAPTIPGLRLRDNVADRPPPLGPSGLPTTDTPVVAWSPVPGASSYEVRVAPWEGFCNWTAVASRAETSLTATTAWTPLGPGTSRKPVGNAFPTVANDGFFALDDGTSYCVRVRARSDRDAAGKEIVSEWTELAGVGQPAFTFRAREQTCAPAAMPPDAYNSAVEPSAPVDGSAPLDGQRTPRMPLFTWDWVPGACGYFVVVARDAEFTKIVDVALTTQAAYAPRLNSMPTTYADETTSYYWVVMPTRDPNGDGLSTQAVDNYPVACRPGTTAPRPACPFFQRQSEPPTPLSPQLGSDVPTQPVFRWTSTEGARQYRIQIADDPTFGDPIADVLTNSTSYSSTSAFPADNVLYWRVRANDENKLGLTWSSTGTFRRRLPVPVVGDNATGGEGIPVLSWAPVAGAVSYDMHVEQVDGTKRDFNMRSTAFTPVIFYGTGIWHWQVRANFRAGTRVVSGGYFSPQPFARRIATPAANRTVKSRGGTLLAWDASRMAKSYRVQVATTDSFSRIIEQATTDNTSWAPRMINAAFRASEALYWRVAAVDEGNNVGGWATSPLRRAPRARMRLKGSLRENRSGVVRVTVTGRKKRPLKDAVVKVQGAGVSSRPGRTNRRGVVQLRLTPRSRGVVRFTADKLGYSPARAQLRVR